MLTDIENCCIGAAFPGHRPEQLDTMKEENKAWQEEQMGSTIVMGWISKLEAQVAKLQKCIKEMI